MIDTQGKFLVAPPKLPDWRFQKSVIYMWKHDVSGAAGVILNKKCTHPDFRHICYEGGIKINDNIDQPIYYGGPVLNNVVGVLHSTDYLLGSSNHFKNQEVAFTFDRIILEDIAKGKGPKKKLITLGMAQWEKGQLEAEFEGEEPRLKSCSWSLLDYDPKLMFGPQSDDFWEMCVSKAVQNKTQELSKKIFKD